MSRMLYLGDILQWVVNRLNNRSLAQHQLVEDGHQLVFHVFSYLGYKLDAIGKQEVKELL